MRCDDEFQHLHSNALARELVEPVASCNAGRKASSIRVIAGAIRRVETKETEDTQIIFGDALCRVADETHAAMAQIVETAGIVVDGAVARCGERVDREVAPLGIRLPVATEFDLGMPAVGLHILAQRGHLEGMLVDDDGDGAVLDTGWNRLEASRRDTFDDFRWHSSRGDIDLCGGHAQQRVAYCPANDPCLFSIKIEDAQKTQQRTACKPAGI